MEFIRQVGNQAEVNDGGKIRRLPFSGEGVAPQPGARVNPVRDACCCPGAIPLEPNREIVEALKSDPRRVSNNKTQKPQRYWCVSPHFSLGGLPLGGDYKFLIYPYDTPVLPIPRNWLQLDCKTRKLKLIKLNPGKISLFFFTFGTIGSGYVKNAFGSVILDNLSYYEQWLQPIARANNLSVDTETLIEPINSSFYLTCKVVDAFWEDYGYAGSDSIKDPLNEFRLLYEKEHKNSQLWVSTPVFKGKLEPHYKKWYKKPDSFTYERLH